MRTALEVNAEYYRGTGYVDAHALYFSDTTGVAFPFAHTRYVVAGGAVTSGPALASIDGCGADAVTAAFSLRCLPRCQCHPTPRSTTQASR